MKLEFLRQIIEERGIKHKVLARHLEMHPTVFSRKVRGITRFEKDKYDLLLKILNLKETDLKNKAA